MIKEMLAAAESKEISAAYKEAVMCHQRVVENGKLAGATLLEMGRALKEMRDKKLYIQLGFESFGQYVEGNGDYCFKERQAYTYIKATESFSEKFLTDHADLGVTKIGLLTALSEGDAVEVIEAHNDLAGMTADEVKELVREKQGLGEQLAFWKDETQKAKDGKADMIAKIDKLTAELERAEAAAEKSEEAKRKAALDQQKAEDKHRAQLAALEEQKKALEAKVSGGAPDEQRAAMKVYFEELQKAVGTFTGKIEQITDEDTKAKYTQGAVKYLEALVAELRGAI